MILSQPLQALIVIFAVVLGFVLFLLEVYWDDIKVIWMGNISYIQKFLGIYVWNVLHWFNRYLLKTYPLIEDCARCRDCGRNVHDFTVPDSLWLEVIGSFNGVWCYDCFCNRADEKFRFKWRMSFPEWTNLKTGEKKLVEK